MKKLGDVIEAQQFDLETIEAIFAIARDMEENYRSYSSLLSGQLLLNVFYEPSSRTRCSFEIALKRLGGICVNVSGPFSSIAKDESLEDTISVLSDYTADVVVLRYHKEGGAKRAQKFSHAPLINAGDGKGQHPTQALLDPYTIQKRFSDIRNLNIVMMGDLENGRTVRSLCYLIGKHFPYNEVVFVSPEDVQMRGDIKEYLTKRGVRWRESYSLNPEIIRQGNIFYQTRIQKERFKEEAPEIFERVTDAAREFIIDEDFLEQMDTNGIIMHPLPRVTEIKYAVDKDPRAFYFTQSKNGLFVRMALLKMILIGY